MSLRLRSSVLLLAVTLLAACDSATPTQTGGVSPTPITPTPAITPGETMTSQIPIPTATIPPAPTQTAVFSPMPATPTPAINVVFVILMENHNWSDIKGNPSAPYINKTLLPQASHAEQYYNPPGLHPSLPNYLWLEAGTNFGILDDRLPSANHQATTDHLVTRLTGAGLSWKAYQEGISGQECPLQTRGSYAPRHNPMVYFDDVTDANNLSSPGCIAHERPYTELASDLQKNTVANYNFITPNLCHDMHDSCAPLRDPIGQGDTWLAAELPKILNSPAYRQGGVVLLTWDEGASDTEDGPIGMIVLSPFAKGKGYANTIHYTHSSTLRTLQEIFGVTPYLGDAANATDLSDLFATFSIAPTSTPAPRRSEVPLILKGFLFQITALSLSKQSMRR